MFEDGFCLLVLSRLLPTQPYLHPVMIQVSFWLSPFPFCGDIIPPGPSSLTRASSSLTEFLSPPKASLLSAFDFFGSSANLSWLAQDFSPRPVNL